jgi:circadian clock protein KaiC
VADALSEGFVPGESMDVRAQDVTGIEKAPTGIAGLDAITSGGLPRGRPTLICGGPGCGKTLFAMEFLVRGATEFDEPGVFVAFEESSEELSQNVRSLGFDLDKLVAENRLAVEYVHVEPGEIQQTGEYDLDGLFLRLGLAIDTVGAKRVVLDTIETLFGGLDGPILRSELRRLFRWFKARGLTCVVTGEKGDGPLTRQGLEEYVSDCVIFLDHGVRDQVSTRRLRVVKYRGSTHGTNEYPFLIDNDGISILPITSLHLNHKVSAERVSSGIPRLDEMLGGEGYYRGSSILVSGTAGTGKTTLGAHFVDAACRRGERCVYLSFEESEAQFVRNMRTIGLDLGRWIADGLLHFHASRPSMHGLEMHLVSIHKLVDRVQPSSIVIDPVSNFASGDTSRQTQSMVLRLVDFLKSRDITALLINLTEHGAALEHTEVNISSLIDTWLLLRDIELAGERNKALYILKSRGMAHSNQIREFVITPAGIDLIEVYTGPEGVLTGSMRVAQEARERALERANRAEAERRTRDVARQRAALEAQIAALNADLSALSEEADVLAEGEKKEQNAFVATRQALESRRGATTPAVGSDTMVRRSRKSQT